MQEVNIGIIGLGNVGTGTLTILTENADQIALKLGFPLRVKALCSRSIATRNLAASVESGQLHVTFRAADGFSPIKRAEYSVDASEWKYVEPVGQLSDAKSESYDFKVTPETAKDGAASSEHVVVVRVYDRYENMGAAKMLVRGK